MTSFLDVSNEHSLHNLDTDTFIQLPSLNAVSYASSGCCTSVSYCSDNKSYILCCIHHINSIYQYDITNTKWGKYAHFPDGLSLHNDGQICFNAAKNELYIVHESVHCKLGIFDIEQKQWVIKPMTDKSKYLYHTFGDITLCYAASPIDEIHLFKGSGHFKFNKEYELIKVMDETQPCQNILWWKTEQKWIQYATFMNIAKLRVADAMKRMSIDWMMKLYSDDLGIDVMDRCQMILILEKILLLFQRKTHCVYFIDLMTQNKRKIDTKLPPFDTVILVDDMYLHFISPQSTHYKVSVMELLSTEIIFSTMSICSKLVNGFVAQTVQTYKLSIGVPVDVISIILRFVLVSSAMLEFLSLDLD